MGADPRNEQGYLCATTQRRLWRPVAEERPYAPVLAFNGARSEVASRIRSAISPWFDIRRPLDVIRDRIEERGLAMLGAGS
jgi:hypothetical protein